VKQIYDGTFSGKLIPGHGVFAELALRSGFSVMDVVDAIAVLRHACIRKVTSLPS
jgi:uncharacterized protein YbbK (DUF523 family)